MSYGTQDTFAGLQLLAERQHLLRASGLDRPEPPRCRDTSAGDYILSYSPCLAES